MTNQKISVLIPAFNEAESLSELNKQIVEVMQANKLDYEIVYIDDGSTDNTYQVLTEIKQQNDHIKIIKFKKNFGKSTALSIGFQEVLGDLIITMDADLQDEPKEIPNFIDKINSNDYDMISGWKQDRKDNYIKLISSKIFNNTVTRLTGIKLHDFNCGFKIYKKEAIKDINIYGELHRFIPVLVYEQGFKVGELKIQHNERKFGESKYGKYGLRRLRSYLLDPINILLLTKYAKKPTHFFGSLGLILLFLGSIFLSYLSIIWLLGQGPIGNRPLLFLSILLIIMGIQLISMGFLGEIIIRGKSKKEKIYYIKK